MPQRLPSDFPSRITRPRSLTGKESAPDFGRFLGAPGLHEIYAAAHVDCAAASGFALAAALQQRRPAAMLWVRHDLLQTEAGSLYPPGLAGLGLAPQNLTLVRAPTVQGVLQAGLEAARCSSLSALIVEFWGETRSYDLTASRRLSLAAKGSKLRLFLVRHAARVTASAAETRWQVKGLASRALAASAPGAAAFEIALLRHRAGVAGQVWCVEWNSETECLEESLPLAAPLRSSPLPGPVAAPASHREEEFLKAG